MSQSKSSQSSSSSQVCVRQRRALPVMIAAASAIATFASSSAYAQTNINWTGTAPGGDTGNWSDTTKWTGGDVPDGLLGAGPTTRVENAVFGPYANNRTVTLDGNYAINGLTIQPRTSGFSGTTFTLNATPTTNVLSIGPGGFTIGGGNTVTINANVEVAANQNWTFGTSSDNTPAATTVAGIISGSGKITRTTFSGSTANTLVLTGLNTFTGGFQQDAAGSLTRMGNSSTVAGGVITNGPVGTGTVTLNAGTFTSNGGTGRTLNNNIVLGGGALNLGSSGHQGSLTFSDVGLTSASTFTLGSATAGNVTSLRTFNTPLTFNQAITESGGANQGLIINSSSGTPTVTFGRTKTATGAAVLGGVATTFGNTTPNAGQTFAMNGSVTATGTGRLSAGGTFTDGATLTVDSLANTSGAPLTVYNNSRAFFGTAPTQAELQGLFSTDSAVRVGLGTSGTPTVSQSYNLSQIGNGRATLSGGSATNTTYTGTLVAGNDGAFRVTGGASTLIFNSALTSANGTSLIVEGGGGTLQLTANNTFAGTTTLNQGTLSVQGSGGRLSGTSAINVNGGSTFGLANVAGQQNADRIPNAAPVTLNGSTFSMTGDSTAAFGEVAGALTVNAGRNFVSVGQTPAANNVKSLTFSSLTQQNNALVVFRGDSLGGTATNRNEIKFTNAPSLTGGGGAAGSTNLSIIPWARGGPNASANADGFVTYETNGVRLLNTTTEYVQASGTTLIDAAIGGNTDRNVRVTGVPTGASATTNVLTAGASPTVNAILFNNTGATAAQTFGLNSGTLNVTSGAVHIHHGASQNLTINGGTIAFGNTPGVIAANTNGTLANVAANITGTGGVSFYATNGGILQLNGANTFTGGVTIGGNGTVAVDNDGRFGDAANGIVHGGGNLQFFANNAYARSLTLLGNVGDNNLVNNNGSGAVTWNGLISGAGRLRLTNNFNNSGTLSSQGFVLSNANTYTGGTQIEGIAVTSSNNTGLGTGTVTLAVANSFIPTLTLSSAAPELGGLRGSEGNVTVNPTAATATLTVGGSNDSTIYTGTINQGTGKTASLRKIGTGTLVLGGNNTYTGATTVDAGTLLVAGSINSAATVNNGGQLSVTGRAGSTAALNGGTLSGTGTIAGAVTSTGGTISSAGTLTGLSTFTANAGTTTIAAGTLNTTGDTISSGALLDVDGTLGGTGALSAAGTLTGTGTVTKGVSVLGTGTVAPAALGVAGQLNLNGGLSLADVSTLAFDLQGTAPTSAGGIGNDLIAALNGLTLDGELDVNALSSFSNAAEGDSWRLFNYTGAFVDNGLTLGTVPSLGTGLTFAVDTSTAGQVNLLVTAVPEPGVLVLAGMAGLGLLRRRRRGEV